MHPRGIGGAVLCVVVEEYVAGVVAPSQSPPSQSHMKLKRSQSQVPSPSQLGAMLGGKTQLLASVVDDVIGASVTTQSPPSY